LRRGGVEKTQGGGENTVGKKGDRNSVAGTKIEKGVGENINMILKGYIGYGGRGGSRRRQIGSLGKNCVKHDCKTHPSPAQKT